MPLRGGSADKIGNRFEGRWTAKAMLDVLREDAQAIRLEPPGAEGKGVEFLVRYVDRVEFHQVKRQRTGIGDWSIAALTSAGVLGAFDAHLANTSAHCKFVSAHSAASLEELSDHARSAQSFGEYDRDFLKSTPLRNEYGVLRKAWGNVDNELILERLRRVHVEIVGEDPLRRWTQETAAVVLQGDQSKALATLFEIALDNVNRYLTPDELWAALAQYSYTPSIWKRPQQAALHVAAANNRYTESRRATLLHGKLLPRPEADEAAKALASSRLLLVDGIAGAGKSDVILKFVQELEANGTPHLVFRLDRVTPTRHPDELGRDLGLPASPSATLAAIAQGRDAVLVVDQLDAVSAVSGRAPQLLECISEVVRSAHAIPNLRIVLVCRTFDIQNDARLRQIAELEKKHASVNVGPLRREQVAVPLARLGYTAAMLSAEQLDLLCIPLHLALLAGATADDQQVSFASSQDLYDAFWRQKRHEITSRLGPSAPWLPIIERLADHMSERQVLRAPAAIVDEWEPCVDAMVSAHVLTRDGRQLAFFHETFFDYAFARTFIGRSGSIRSLLAQDQFLFRRAQIRQILTHQRHEAPDDYDRDVAYLLQDAFVRFHLRDLVASWLTQVSPTPAEWELVKSFLLDVTSPLFARAWRTLLSLEWFKFADAAGFIEARLGEEQQFTERMVSIVAFVSKDLPGRVAELLAPFANDPKWWSRIGSVISQADLGASRPLLDLFLNWIDRWDRTATDDQSIAVFGHTAEKLAKSRPDWGAELLARFIATRMDYAKQAGFDNPFDRNAVVFHSELHLDAFIETVASMAPAAFIDHVWPLMFRIVERTANEPDDGLRIDATLPQRRVGGLGQLEDSLMDALENAVRLTAQLHPERFDRLIAEHQQTRYETVAYLLYEGFRAAPERYADVALAFVLSDKARFRVGYLGGDHWATRRLLAAVTPHAAAASVAELETELLTYYPDTRRDHGYAQFALLGGIDAARRSSETERRIEEFQRKFNEQDASLREVVVMHSVNSPIPAESARRMSDDQWLRAIAKHSLGFRERERIADFFKGGADELSNVLKDEAKQDPERFARLALRIPDESNEAYFHALLLGVTEAREQPPEETVRALVAKCHQLPGRPCGRFIASLLQRHPPLGVSEELLEVLSWYALKDPEPQRNDTGQRGLGRPDLDLLNDGLNTVRGGIATAIAAVVSASPKCAHTLDAAIRKLVSDPVTAVRVLAAEIICALVPTAPETAQALFLELVRDPDDRLLITRGAHHYLLWQTSDDFEVLRPIIDRMIQSPLPEVRKHGAAFMNLAALSRDDARETADACTVSSDEALRLGAAMVFKSNLKTSEYAQRCTSGLERFFNDPSPEVRKTAGSVFWRLESAELGDHIGLALSFLRSTAFEGNADDLIHALTKTTAAVPELILATCERGLDAFEAARKGPLMHHVAEALSLVLRAYADSDDRQRKDRALDLVDRALRLDVYGMNKLLTEHDRWWGQT